RSAVRGPPGPPALVFSTPFACVPPFFPSRLEGDRVYGRGSCDAKGILAAQVSAADRLRRDGEPRVGLVFVVGEERGSDGARAANDAGAAGGRRVLIKRGPAHKPPGRASPGHLRAGRAAPPRARPPPRPAPRARG